MGRGLDRDPGEGSKAAAAGTPLDPAPVRRVARSRLRWRARQRASLRQGLAKRTCPSSGPCLCPDELRARGSLPVRLEPRAITLQGLPLMIKAAHMKLSHSRMPFVRAYFRETQELVFDAHDKAFAFYGGVCRRGIYDNMKTAVEAIFVGKARQYNRRFLQMCSHHLIEPVACTPAPGPRIASGACVRDDPGAGVENQVGNLRDLLFRPKPRVKSLVELNAWLEDQCIAGACPRAGEARPVGPANQSSGVQGPDDLGRIPG